MAERPETGGRERKEGDDRVQRDWSGGRETKRKEAERGGTVARSKLCTYMLKANL